MFKKAQVTALALASLVLCANAYADQSVVIGYAGPLTGGSANAGKDAENGVRLAIDEANSQNIKIGGQTARFSVSVQDDAADPRQAVLVAQKLIDAKVAGVVGHLNSGATIPASKVYSDAGVPQISPSATNPMYTQQGFPTAFRVIGNDGTVARALVAQMKAEGKIKKVAVIDDATAYGQGLADLAVAELKKAGLEVARREKVTDKTVDFKSVLTGVKASHPDAVFYGGIDAQAGPLRRQMGELGIKVPLFGAAIETDTFMSLAGPAAKDTYSAESGQPPSGTERGKQFLKAFEAKYGKVVLFAPYAYDATWALINAMKAANSADPTKYLPALKKIDFPGAGGQIAFDDHGDLKRASVTIFKVDGEHFKVFRVVD